MSQVNKKNFLWIFSILLFSGLVVFFSSCEDDGVDPDPDGKPIVETVDVTANDDGDAFAKGRILDIGDSEIKEAGFVYSTDIDPTIKNSIGVVTATINNNEFEATIDGLAIGGKYYIRAYAKNDEANGTGYGESIEYTVEGEFELIQDIDGNEYGVVQIGSNLWMAENLRTTRFANGEPINYIEGSGVWAGLSQASYSVYDPSLVGGIGDESSMAAAYGNLYNFYAVDDPRGLCPPKFRVPTDDEWTELTELLAGGLFEGGKELKSCRQVDYVGTATGCNTTEHPRWDKNEDHYGIDAFGFSGLPAGYRFADGTFDKIGEQALFWTSTEEGQNSAWRRNLYHSNDIVGRFYNYKSHGFSVRCIRDDNHIIAPTVGTVTITNTTSDSAIGVGVVEHSGGADVTKRGFVWSTVENPTIDVYEGMKEAEDDGLGEFEVELTGLTPGVVYYVRAFATNTVGTGHGAQLTFETNTTTYYTIEATSGFGGEIFPNGDVEVEEGTDKEFIIQADVDFVIYDVIVDGLSEGAVEDYTFNNVTTNHTIYATFTPTTSTGD